MKKRIHLTETGNFHIGETDVDEKLSPPKFILCISHPHLSLLCGNFLFLSNLLTFLYSKKHIILYKKDKI